MILNLIIEYKYLYLELYYEMLCIATWKFTLTNIIIVIFWLFQQIAFKNLVQRNREMEQTQGPPASNSAIQLPFIIVNTSKKTVIDCSISNDK